MASADKKTKTEPAAKKDAPKDAAKGAPKDVPKDTAKSTAETAPSKPEGGEKPDAAPSSYSRGEGQKPVTQAYKDNWNAIFAKKKKKR